MSVMPLKVEAETNVISIGDLGFLYFPVILCSFQSISKEKKKKNKLQKFKYKTVWMSSGNYLTSYIGSKRNHKQINK